MDATIMRVIRLALSVICDRLATIVSLVMTFALSSWAMDAPTYERLAMAAFFAIFVFIPCIWLERRHHEGQQEQQY
jgi:hypothetical protein